MVSDRFSLEGRSALVTGGSKGIGKAIALAFSEAGAEVMLASRHEDELAASAADIVAKTGRRVEFRVTDMSVREQVAALADAAMSSLGKVDILVNNAGSNRPEPVASISDAAWDEIIELNLTSCVMLTRALVPGMVERGFGRIIYLASIMAIVGAPDRSLYCATKGALVSLSHAQATELGKSGVTVNCISPGPILTDLPRSMFSAAQRDQFAQRTALERWGTPDEIASPALLLASDAGSYMTGANLVVDGGCTIKAF